MLIRSFSPLLTASRSLGEGLNTAFEAMKRLRLQPPAIEETNSSLIVKIKHEPLATPEQSIMDYLENHSEITNRVARELTGIRSENSMKEVPLSSQGQWRS